MGPSRIETARVRKLLRLRDVEMRGGVSEVAGGDWERDEARVLGRRRSEVEGQTRRRICEEVLRSKGHCYLFLDSSV